MVPVPGMIPALAGFRILSLFEVRTRDQEQSGSPHKNDRKVCKNYVTNRRQVAPYKRSPTRTAIRQSPRSSQPAFENRALALQEINMSFVARKFAMAIVLTSVIVAQPSAARAGDVSVKWQPNVKSAVSVAQKEERPLLVYVSTAQCGYCRKLERTTWTDQNVARLVQTDFVPVKIHGEKNLKFCNRMGIDGFPTTLVLSPDGELIAKVDGYVPPQEMLKRLNAVKPVAEQD